MKTNLTDSLEQISACPSCGGVMLAEEGLYLRSGTQRFRICSRGCITEFLQEYIETLPLT